jgi:hypothetical protein
VIAIGWSLTSSRKEKARRLEMSPRSAIELTEGGLQALLLALRTMVTILVVDDDA